MDKSSKKQKISSDSDGFERCISNLPDHLLLHILSFLLMKDRVRTGCLSTRWKNLWKSVPIIDFTQTDIHRTPDLIAVIDKALSYHYSSQVREFCINAESDLCSMSKVESWIDFVVRHNIEVMYLDFHPVDENVRKPLIPSRLFESNSLTTLTLKFCIINVASNYCLVSLKTIHFECMEFGDNVLAALLTNCPIIKDLTLENCNRVTDLKIVAANSHLENLCIDEDNSDVSDDETVFEISAPNLLTLNFIGLPKRSKYIGKNIESLVSVDFNFMYPPEFTPFWKTQKEIPYGSFIKDFCHAKVLKLSCWCTMNLSFREILNIGTSVSNTVTDLTFETECWECSLAGLVYVLKNFINLEVLRINVVQKYDTECNDFSEEERNGGKACWRPNDTSVFGRQQNLKIVEIHGFLGSSCLSTKEEIMTTESILNLRNTEFKFIEFLLKNLTELKTMTITTTKELNDFPESKRSDIVFQLVSRSLVFTKPSRNARVLINPDELTDEDLTLN